MQVELAVALDGGPRGYGAGREFMEKGRWLMVDFPNRLLMQASMLLCATPTRMTL